MQNFKIIVAVIFLILIAACSNSNENDIIIDDFSTDLHNAFDGTLPDDIIETLIFMGKNMGYSLDELLVGGNIVLDCNLEAPCILQNFDDDFAADYGLSFHQVNLPEREINLTDDSTWVSSFDDTSNLIVLTHKTKNMQIELDLDNGFIDGLNYGITPIINDKRIEPVGDLNSKRFLVPTQDGGKIEKIIVNINADIIEVEYIGGTYGDLFAAGGFCEICDENDPEEVFMKVNIFVNPLDKIEIDLTGLYYIWFTKGGTTVEMQYEDGTENLVIEQEDYFRRYYEDVTHLNIQDVELGSFDITTQINRLQFDAQDHFPGVWQLDYDHSYKDRGQKSVETNIIVN